MARRTKKIVWHKRRQKFLGPSALKPGKVKALEKVAVLSAPAPERSMGERRQAFIGKTLAKIRQAVR